MDFKYGKNVLFYLFGIRFNLKFLFIFCLINVIYFFVISSKSKEFVLLNIK